MLCPPGCCHTVYTYQRNGYEPQYCASFEACDNVQVFVYPIPIYARLLLACQAYVCQLLESDSLICRAKGNQTTAVGEFSFHLISNLCQSQASAKNCAKQATSTCICLSPFFSKMSTAFCASHARICSSQEHPCPFQFMAKTNQSLIGQLTVVNKPGRYDDV